METAGCFSHDQRGVGLGSKTTEVPSSSRHVKGTWTTRLVAVGVDLGCRAEVASVRFPRVPFPSRTGPCGRTRPGGRRLHIDSSVREMHASPCPSAHTASERAFSTSAPCPRVSVPGGGERPASPGLNWGLRDWEAHVLVSRPVDPATTCGIYRPARPLFRSTPAASLEVSS